jgi:hypothetical protein
MIFELRGLSTSRVLLCIALTGAFIGLGFLLVGADALKWVGLLLLAIPVVLVNVRRIGRAWRR